VVGVTFECDEPPEARTRTIVSNTTLPAGLSPGAIDAEVRARLAAGDDLYRLDADALRQLVPEIVVTQNLCAVCAVDVSDVDEALAYLGCRADVVTIDPGTLEDVLDSITRLGVVTHTDMRASALLDLLRSRLHDVAIAVEDRPRPRMTVLEWTDPPFSAGHWLPDMVTAAGATPALGASGQRSMAVTWADVTSSDPALIVVAPCGYRLDGAAELARGLVESGVLPAGVPVWAVVPTLRSCAPDRGWSTASRLWRGPPTPKPYPNGPTSQSSSAARDVTSLLRVIKEVHELRRLGSVSATRKSRPRGRRCSSIRPAGVAA